MKTPNITSAPIIGTDLRQFFEKLSINELLELEEFILHVIRKKIKSENGEQSGSKEQGDWRKDFLSISVWSHLDDNKGAH